MHKWVIRVLLSIDQFFNALTGGDEDETISSRLGKARKKGSRLASLLCIPLDLIDSDHCLTAIEEDEG